jgi:peptidoglycan/LPS O-acetylase OafA/YrhL
MKISEFLHKDKNNLNLIRIILACMVIIGHSEVLMEKVLIDPVKKLFEFTYAGAFAVKLFFLLVD